MVVYPSPKNLFQQKIKTIFEKETKETTSLIADILKLFCMFKLNRPQHAKNWEPLNEVFNRFGIRTFVELLDIFDGKTIRFPTRKEIKDLIMAALCYYYKEIENKSWDEIKTLLGIQENNTIQYGIKVRQLKTFLDQSMNQLLFKKKRKKS
jgi:hypothetical protein